MPPLPSFARFSRLSRRSHIPPHDTAAGNAPAGDRRRARVGAGTAVPDPARIVSLPYAAGLRAVADLLVAMGYEDVRPTGRTGFRGRNRAGGYDLEAFTPPFPLPPADIFAFADGPGSGRRRRVVVQFKRYAPDAPVFRRQVDELRGACLRAGADGALLITTGAFSPTAEDLSWAKVAPVRLIDGRELASLLTAHGVVPTRGHGDSSRSSRPAAPSVSNVSSFPSVPSVPPRPVAVQGPAGQSASVRAVVSIVFGTEADQGGIRGGSDDAAAPEGGGEARGG